MAKRLSNKTEQPENVQTAKEWASPSLRVQWLLNTKYGGNRSEMARAIDFSHTAVSKAVSGSTPPGRRFLTAIVEKLGVDAAWLLSGKGEPFGVPADLSHDAIWMPVHKELPSIEQVGVQDTGAAVRVPALRPSCQSWYRIGPNEPVLRAREFGLQRGDLILLETDRSKFPSEERLNDHLCAVRDLKDGATIRLGKVQHDDGTGLLYLDLFEDPSSEFVREHIVREHPDGHIEAVKRDCRKHVSRGRTSYVPVDSCSFIVSERKIDYEAIVAIWIGILIRRFGGLIT